MPPLLKSSGGHFLGYILLALPLGELSPQVTDTIS